MTTYIFDFDGTIADSFSLATHIVINHADYLGCKQLTTNEILLLKDMHARDVFKYLGIPFWRIASFVKKLRGMTKHYVDDVTIFPEWVTILKTLSTQEHQIGLISSNSQHTVEFLLKKYQLFHFFDFVLCDESVFGKKRCLLKLIRQKKLPPSSIYYVGDEVRDIEAAHAAKVNSVAVTWGFNSSAKLKQAEPSHLITTFDQLTKVLCETNLS